MFIVASGLMSQKSILQSTITLSTIEVEYMAASKAAKEALWLKGFMKELGILKGEVLLFCNSQSILCLAKNQVYHARSKHIDVWYHMIRELLNSREISLRKVHTEKNVTNILMKVVTIDKFYWCLDILHIAGMLMQVECIQDDGLTSTWVGAYAKVEIVGTCQTPQLG